MVINRDKSPSLIQFYAFGEQIFLGMGYWITTKLYCSTPSYSYLHYFQFNMVWVCNWTFAFMFVFMFSDSSSISQSVLIKCFWNFKLPPDIMSENVSFSSSCSTSPRHLTNFTIYFLCPKRQTFNAHPEYFKINHPRKSNLENFACDTWIIRKISDYLPY